MIVTINTGINASVTIDEIGDAFAKGSINQNITDQSEDATSGNGDFNANFDETYVAGPGHGVIWRTTLIQAGSVLLGPSGAPAAVGPTDNNDDYTNKSTNPANIAPGGVTTAVAQLVYTNTLQNTGNANDTYTLDAPVVPAGFTVEISTNGGGSYTDVSSGGSTFPGRWLRRLGKHPRARHGACRQTRLNRVQHHGTRHFDGYAGLQQPDNRSFLHRIHPAHEDLHRGQWHWRWRSDGCCSRSGNHLQRHLHEHFQFKW